MSRLRMGLLATLTATIASLCIAGPARADEALARQSGCIECHAEKDIGPSFAAVAARYRNDARARAALTATVRRGGKGNWTEISRGVPMPPYSGRLSDEQIARLVDWVMGH